MNSNIVKFGQQQKINESKRPLFTEAVNAGWIMDIQTREVSNSVRLSMCDSDEDTVLVCACRPDHLSLKREPDVTTWEHFVHCHDNISDPALNFDVVPMIQTITLAKIAVADTRTLREFLGSLDFGFDVHVQIVALNDKSDHESPVGITAVESDDILLDVESLPLSILNRLIGSELTR